MDDGAQTIEQSISMLEMAVRAGTTDIVATPHASVEYPYDAAVIRRRFAEISAAAPQGIRIHLGCDFHVKHDNVADAVANPTRYTVNGGRYLLIELSDLTIFKNTEAEFARLQAAGMVLIVTHPERNALLRQRLQQLRSWVEMGCYLQVTGDSLLGRFGGNAEAFAKTLIKEGLCHFLASDAHGLQHRSPKLDKVWKWVGKHYGDACATLLLRTNPEAVFTNDARRLDAPKQERKRRFGLF